MGKMGFWVAVMTIAIVAIIMGSVIHIVKMAFRHDENVKRIKHGYPTLDGTEPLREEQRDRLQ